MQVPLISQLVYEKRAAVCYLKQSELALRAP